MQRSRGILVTQSLIRPIMDGGKTCTRRLAGDRGAALKTAHCPYGEVGDLLYVRETWKVGSWKTDGRMAIDYKAGPIEKTPWVYPLEEDFKRLAAQSLIDCETAHKLDPSKVRFDGDQYLWGVGQSPCRWRPSIHMPKWAARIWLQITEVKIQRLQDITEEEAVKEGVFHYPAVDHTFIGSFKRTWENLVTEESDRWTANPWVWAIAFQRVKQ